MNRAILLGRLTKDPDLNTTSSGISVCSFTLAISRRYSNSNGERETDFINIVAWRTNAEICHKYLKKGSQVSIIGSIQTRTYDAQDGTKRTVTEVVAEEVEFVGSKASNGGQEETQSEEKPKVSKLEPIDDTLPF
ncbi:MAG: single-stranded DNA-binding protein [Clostridia bacterium]|nr:single-stranded DNA-binding protein [Clostridia bacterium]